MRAGIFGVPIGIAAARMMQGSMIDGINGSLSTYSEGPSGDSIARQPKQSPLEIPEPVYRKAAGSRHDESANSSGQAGCAHPLATDLPVHKSAARAQH